MDNYRYMKCFLFFILLTTLDKISSVQANSNHNSITSFGTFIPTNNAPSENWPRLENSSSGPPIKISIPASSNETQPTSNIDNSSELSAPLNTEISSQTTSDPNASTQSPITTQTIPQRRAIVPNNLLLISKKNQPDQLNNTQNLPNEGLIHIGDYSDGKFFGAEGHRNAILESLLSKLTNFQFRITPKVKKFNDTTYVSFTTTVVQISNDTLELNSVFATPELVRSLLQNPNQQTSQNDDHLNKNFNETITTQAPNVTPLRSRTSQDAQSNSVKNSTNNVTVVKVLETRQNDSENSSTTDGIKLGSIVSNETTTNRTMKNSLESNAIKDFFTSTNMPFNDNSNQARSTPIPTIQTTNSTNIPPTVELVNNTNISNLNKVPNGLNMETTNETIKNALKSDQIRTPKDKVNEAINYKGMDNSPVIKNEPLKKETINANRTTDSDLLSFIWPNGPVKKAPETPWKPAGILSGPKYDMTPSARSNQLNYGHYKNEVLEKNTRNNHMQFQSNKLINPINPNRSPPQGNQRQVSIPPPPPQQTPRPYPILIKLQNTPLTPSIPQPPGQAFNNPNVNVVATRDHYYEDYKYPIGHFSRDSNYNHYNVENQIDRPQYRQTITQPRSGYTSGQPFAIEEIVHSQSSPKNQLQLHPELFVQIIREYFDNVVAPKESKLTFERKVPIV